MPALRIRLSARSAVMLMLIIVSCMTGLSAFADPELITFEDLPSPPTTFGSIASGYDGFDWGFGSANAAYYATLGSNGDSNGAIGKYDAVTSVAGTGSITPADGKVFDLDSFYLTAGWNTNLHVLMTGFANGVQVDQTSFIVSTSGPTLEMVDWDNLSEVTFQGSGGTGPGLYTVVLDNISVVTDATDVPEPADVAIFGSGLLAVLSLRFLHYRFRVR